MRHALLVSLLLLFSASAQAAGKSEGLAIVTGPKAGTYIAFGRDIARVAQAAGIALEVKESGGSLDNIKRITSGENAALGIVQSDVLGFLKRSKNAESIRTAHDLRMVFPLHQEEVHVLARKAIANFSDLSGKRVVVGAEGSGSMLTAINLMGMMDVKPGQMLKITPAEGVLAVLKGDADAMVFVGGKPVRLFKNLEELGNDPKNAELLKGVHLLPLADPKMLEEYSHADISPGDYSFVKTAIPTIAVTAVLVSYDFSGSKSAYGRSRCKMLNTIGRGIRANMDWLRLHGHPKWKEVNLDADVGIWRKDACSRLVEATPTPAAEQAVPSSELEKDLLGVIQEQAPVKETAKPKR